MIIRWNCILTSAQISLLFDSHKRVCNKLSEAVIAPTPVMEEALKKSRGRSRNRLRQWKQNFQKEEIEEDVWNCGSYVEIEKIPYPFSEDGNSLPVEITHLDQFHTDIRSLALEGMTKNMRNNLFYDYADLVAVLDEAKETFNER